MDEKQLQDKIAYLESYNDQLEAELNNVDDMMRIIGFADGLATIKETAEDIFHEECLGEDDPQEGFE